MGMNRNIEIRYTAPHITPRPSGLGNNVCLCVCMYMYEGVHMAAHSSRSYQSVRYEVGTQRHARVSEYRQVHHFELL